MIYLASKSPRRAELLRQIGLKFETLAIDVDETQLPGEFAEAYVMRIAKDKAEAGGRLVSPASSEALVLGADTIIAIDGKIIGKPGGTQDCQRMLTFLSAKTHQVMTAIALRVGNRTQVKLSTNRVRFRALDTDEIEAYCASAEPLDKAGAYAIQGKAAVFIEHLEGSYSSVMGLPLFETAKILKQAGKSVFNT